MTATFEIPASVLYRGSRAVSGEANSRAGVEKAVAGKRIRRPNAWIANC